MSETLEGTCLIAQQYANYILATLQHPFVPTYFAGNKAVNGVYVYALYVCSLFSVSVSCAAFKVR